MPDSHRSIEIFCSYAPTDEQWCQDLEAHLSLLQSQRLISWHHRRIASGTDWTTAIDTHIDSATLILLLISPDFFASNYCYGIEMERALQRHQTNQTRVIPILLRPVDWKGTLLEQLQVLPANAQPITTWNNRNEAFTDVATSIRRALDGLAGPSASTPRAALSSVWNVPYLRNTFFTGHEGLLLHLETLLQAGLACALSQPEAVSGHGGIGKTQIAVEYAYQHHQDYQAVLWARAESRETLISSFVDIAALLRLPEKDAQDHMLTMQAVKIWLQTHRGWLLILDNADELVMVRQFLPPALSGHLLLTTRVQALGGLAQRIEVDTFTAELGALFLLRRASLVVPDTTFEQAAPRDREVAMQISQELGGLPLALDQAGAYLEETSCQLEDYQRIYQRHRSELLKEHRELAADHPEPAAITWSLSFARVEEKNSAAAELLRLCAYLSPESIPEGIITQGAPYLGPVLEPVASDLYALYQAIEVLRAYSLVQHDPNTRTLSIHRLVQTLLRDAMPTEVTKLWAERTVRAVNAAFPEVEFAQWLACEQFLPHAQTCCGLMEQDQMSLPEMAELLTKVGWYLRERGQYQEAEAPLQQALMLREHNLGPEYLDTAQSLDFLARLYKSQGKYGEAEPLLQRALAIREAQLGAEHLDTATSLNNLALLYKSQGKLAEAEPLYQRALTIYQQHLGAEHLDTATSLNNLALLYKRQDKFAEAEPLFQGALAIYQQQLGAQHPDTATILTNLADLYMSQKKYTEAELLFQRALAIREAQLGAQHPDTATSLNNLAGLYKSQGKFVQAKPLYQRVLAIYHQQLGAQHPDTATILTNLADLYMSQSKFARAEPLYERALAIREAQLGAQHPDTATTLNDLALLYQRQGKLAQAEPLYQRALAICEQEWGAEHPNTATSLNDLALLYKSWRKYAEAEPLYQRALAVYQQQLGQEHPDTLVVLRNYASLLRAMGQDEDATTLLETYAKQP